MAKDTEKLIRQLSLISFLMAERRPVTALEIKQDVEGYSQMNDEAFARRFYADRAELESLGIHLKVDKPAEGYYEAENYSLPPENFYLPAIEFTDKELGALRTSLSLLDGEFAYAEPLRLALQQLSWGKPSPLDAPEQRSVALAVTAGAGGRELSQRLSKVETAIFRRKTIVFDYYTIGRDAQEKRKVDPYHLLYRGGQFYLIGYSHERDDVRVFRVSRIRGKVGYSSKAEHDFNRPEDFDPRVYATRTDWQLGDPVGRARIWLSDRIDWLALRHFGHAGEVTEADEGVIFETDYANGRQMVSWVLGLGEQARIEGPPELVSEARERLKGRLMIDYVIPDYYAKRPKSCMGGWGRQFLNVSPAGKVLPCHAAESITGLEFDRVQDKPLAEIWRHSPLFQQIRGLRLEDHRECVPCPHKSWCVRDRGAAVTWSGSYTGTDPLVCARAALAHELAAEPDHGR